MRSSTKFNLLKCILLILFILCYCLTYLFTNKPKTIYTARGHVSIEQITREIFKPLGLVLVDEMPVFPKLKYEVQPKCGEIYSDWLEKSKNYNESAHPPREIPADLKNDYTMGGYAHLKMNYQDDRSGVKMSKWDMIEDIIKLPFDNFRKEWMSYNKKGVGVYKSMQYHSLAGLEGVVVGSLNPWVEVSALKNGANKVTTIEYMKIEVVGTDKVEYIHPVQLAKNAEKYGDVPDPIGDIREMLKIRCLLKDGALFFFGTPMGPDALTFNLHRVYGRIRLSMMFAGFELVNIFEDENPNPIEVTEEDFGPHIDVFRYKRQPVFVLRKV